jgi:SAM-dependent methyltransferase
MSHGYVTDVAYTRQFCPHLAPTLLRSVAALEGFAPPPEDAFDYCEVGCGPGDTIATLAAAYPRARFVGIDLNAEHVAFARGLAVRGGLSNLRLVEGDFETLVEAALPRLDYVSVHGLLTWIAPEKRRALVAFAARKLKPGGLLHVAYNTLPGWAALEPLRRLLLDAAGTDGATAERAQRALDAAKALADRGALYFVTNPAARDMLGAMVRHGAPYVAHEYFHAHWNPMYVTDVAREMAAEGLAYVGQLPSYRNVPELALPPSLADAATHTIDRVALEQLVDFAANEFFRGDVYRARDDGQATASTAAEYLDATSFGTLVDADRIPRQVKLPHRVLQLDGEIEAALLERLPRRAATARVLSEDPALERFGANRIRAALVRLLGLEQIVPMRASSEGPATLYNHAILEQPLAEQSPVVLAAPAAGTGVQVSALQAVCLRLLTWIEPAERAPWLRAYVERQPLRLHVGGAPVEDRAEQARVLAQEVEKFRTARLPKLVELGVVAPQGA